MTICLGQETVASVTEPLCLPKQGDSNAKTKTKELGREVCKTIDLKKYFRRTKITARKDLDG
jgi:hypothetical protein